MELGKVKEFTMSKWLILRRKSNSFSPSSEQADGVEGVGVLLNVIKRLNNSFTPSISPTGIWLRLN